MFPASQRAPDPCTSTRVGVVTYDRDLVQALQRAVAEWDGTLCVASDAASAHALLESFDAQAVLVDFAVRDLLPWPGLFPGLEGLLLVHRECCCDHGDRKPRFVAYERGELAAVIDQLRGISRCARTLRATILGDSQGMREVREQIRRIARFPDVPVLVLGETGTGKELVAESIHAASGHSDRPFVAINCAAIPEALLESELFGHEAGAFTGARAPRAGLLEAAGDGTIFLDEIGEMPASLQPKLLRALESRTFRRVGANAAVQLRARVLSATNRRTVGERSVLRADLYYRLSGFQIFIPPLRDRREDIADLARHFVDAFADRNRIARVTLSSRAIRALEAHDWPGNVRELRAVIEHAAISARSHGIDEVDVARAIEQRRPSDPAILAAPPAFVAPAPAPIAPPTGERSLRDVERQIILDAFERNGRNVSRTASQLRIPRSTLRGKLRKYGADSGRESSDG